LTCVSGDFGGETLFAKENVDIFTPDITLEILRAMSKKLLSKHYMIIRF
jgi:hypothetical protein